MTIIIRMIRSEGGRERREREEGGKECGSEREMKGGRERNEGRE